MDSIIAFLEREIRSLNKTRIISKLYPVFMIILAVLVNIFVYFDDLDLFIQINIMNVIILVVSALFHFILSKPFWYLRGKNEQETYAEHYILVVIGMLAYYIYFIYYLPHPHIKIETPLAIFWIIICAIPIIYIIAASYVLLFNRNNLFVDIFSQIFAIYLSSYLFSYFRPYFIAIFILFLVAYLIIFQETKKI